MSTDFPLARTSQLDGRVRRSRAPKSRPSRLPTRADVESGSRPELIDQTTYELSFAPADKEQAITVAVRHARGAERLLLLLIEDADRERWRSTFRTPYPVRVRLDGQWRAGRAWLLGPGQLCWREVRHVVNGRHPASKSDDGCVFLAVSLVPPPKSTVPGGWVRAG